MARQMIQRNFLFRLALKGEGKHFYNRQTRRDVVGGSPHDRTAPLIEIYDTDDVRPELGWDLGQFVARYYVETFMSSSSNRRGGLCMQGGSSKWTLSEEDVKAVQGWIIAEIGTELAFLDPGIEHRAEFDVKREEERILDEKATEKRQREDAERTELRLAFFSTDEGKAIHADYTNAKSQLENLLRERIGLQNQIEALTGERIDSLIKKHKLAGCLTTTLAPSKAKLARVIDKRVSAAQKKNAADTAIQSASILREQVVAEIDTAYQAFAAEYNSLMSTPEIAACQQRIDAIIVESTSLALVRDTASKKFDAGIRAIEQSRQVGATIQ